MSPLGVSLILTSLSPENAKDTGQVRSCCERGPRVFALNLEDEVTDDSRSLEFQFHVYSTCALLGKGKNFCRQRKTVFDHSFHLLITYFEVDAVLQINVFKI